ncbi:MAG: MtrB/PioB family decaheme-associated outer membrane protein [Acidobacteria bacterium]|nr:MtrB/PioB family decaheme-associated outer membrane protein [Acidobacteriota bacterium]
MRSRSVALMGALLMAAALPAAAQNASQPAPQGVGSFDIGGRLFTVEGEPARPQRYRDLGDGTFAENFTYRRDDDRWRFTAKATHVGYRDQQYEAAFNQFGKVKAWFEWNQIPIFYSTDTRTPYTAASAGVLRIDDAAQRAASLAAVAPLAAPFDLRARRDTGRFGVSVTPTPALDLTLNVSTAAREGQMPWAGTFGFSNAVELPAPIDHRTTDLNAAAEWGSDRGSVRLQYDGSWFDNQVQTLVWDNPLRISDSPTAGSSQGRMALWPNSTLHAVGVTGTLRLPARSRATAYVSVGSWNQDEALLPFTVNAAISPIPLDRATAQAEAQITATNLSFTSRPADRLWFTARFRRYDFDNQTPEFRVTSRVAYDQSLQTSLLGGTHAFGYIRNWFDADASYDLTRSAAVRVGYGLEDVERTFRLFEETTEHIFRASIDSTGNQYVTVRGVYERGTRTGTGLDEEVLDEIGEQISLRQFDISDRHRDRFSAIVQVTPVAQLGVNGTVGLGKDHRPDAHFGLLEAQTRFYSLGVDVVPRDEVSAGVTWGFDKYTSLQRSRQANPGPQFDDPTRDWSTDAADRVHYVTGSLDLIRAIPKTDVRFGYDFNRSRSRYVYLLPANTTLAAPQQLPEVLNALHRATVDVKYFFAARLAAGVGYWFDKYTIEDFALGPGTITRVNMPGALLLGYVWRPYTANTVWARLTYFW